MEGSYRRQCQDPAAEYTPHVDPDDRRRLIDTYSGALSVFEAAVETAKNRDLTKRPSPDNWSPAEVIHHIADTEVIASGRLRMLLARDGVPIMGYDEEMLGRAADPVKRPVDESLQLIRSLHTANLSLLKTLHLKPWDHNGVHEEGGRYGVDTWVTRRVDHLRGHAEQLRTGS